MKTKLQKDLAKIAPSISIQTIWKVDEDCGPISKECDIFDPSDDYNWTPWQSNISAIAIVNGEEIEGNAYLGGTWEKAGDLPEESNPDISGYEPQMTAEALRELGEQITDIPLASQIIDAIRHCEGIA